MLRRSIFLSFLMTLAAGMAVAADSAGSLAVIVNPSNTVADLSLADLREILLGKRTTWPNGRKVMVVTPEAGNTERQAVLKIVCGMNESEFQRHSLQSSFSTGAQAKVVQMSSAAGIRGVVAGTAGALGFLRANQMDASLKAIRVDGSAAGDPQYKLTLR
jgi:ABC-type phosphate transport system substrate-binding protein